MPHQSSPLSSVSKESAVNAGDLGLIPGSRSSPAEGNGHPLQYSFLESSMDRGAQQATVHGLARVGHDLATKPPPPGTPGYKRLLPQHNWPNLSGRVHSRDPEVGYFVHGYRNNGKILNIIFSLKFSFIDKLFSYLFLLPRLLYALLPSHLWRRQGAMMPGFYQPVCLELA